MGFAIGGFVALMLVGYVVGHINERRHYASIREREAASRGLMIFSARDMEEATDGAFVYGNAVISIDYFKRFLAGLRRLVGGNLDAYESLVERARREAILRMKDEAAAFGATHVVNVKLATSRVFQSEERGGTGSVEVLAYGTAVKRPAGAP